MPTPSTAMHKQRWTDGETEKLAAHYGAVGNDRLVELFGDRTSKALRNQAHRIGLRKSHERLREMGRENVERRYAALRTPPPIET